MIDRIRAYFSPQERRIIGAEAKQLLENKHFREAFSAVHDYLVEAAKACDPDNKDKTQRVVISLQLMEAIEREIVRKIEDGEFAKVEIEELERKRALRVFRR